MPRQYDLVVFDWDGTLVDSSQVIVDSLQAASRDAGLPVPSAAAARGIIGLSLKPAIAALFDGIGEEQLGYLVERYGYHFHARDHEIALFDGVAASLGALEEAGVMLAVATGKGRRGLEHAFDQTGLRDRFVASRCADECFSKPHPQMLNELLAELDTPPQRALMVGDTSYDLLMARNAGIDSLAVSYGAQPLEALLQHAPLAHFDRYAEVHRWLMANV